MKDVVLLTGEEDYLIRLHLERLKKKASSDFDIFELQNPTEAEIINACLTFPFGARKVVVVYDETLERNMPGLEIYIKKPLSSTLLVLVCKEIDKRKTMYKLLDKYADKELCVKLKGIGFINFIQALLKENQAVFGDDIPRFIAQHTCYELSEDARLGEIVSDISRLCSFAGGTPITTEMVKKQIQPCIDTNVFKLTGYIAKGKYAEAMVHMKGLLDTGSSEFHLLSLLMKHFRILYKVKVLSDKSLIGLTPFMWKEFENAGAVSVRSIENSISLISTTTSMLKRGEIGFQLGMELLIAQLCQEVSHV